MCGAPMHYRAHIYVMVYGDGTHITVHTKTIVFEAITVLVCLRAHITARERVRVGVRGGSCGIIHCYGKESLNAAEASLGADGALRYWFADQALECWCAGELWHTSSKW